MMNTVSRINILLVLIIATITLLLACNNEAYTESIKSESCPTPQLSISSSASQEELVGLQSSDNLKDNCEPKIAETRDSFRNNGLEAGTMAIDFTLKDTFGNEVILSELLAKKPVVMVFGSFT